MLWASKDFVLLPALGSFVPNYVLLVARNHWPSAAQLTCPELRSIQEQLDVLVGNLGLVSPKWVVFEHGASGRVGSCCIDHLHYHCVPLDWDLASVLAARLDAPMRELESLAQLHRLEEEGIRGYLFVRNADGRRFVLQSDNIPSQYVRQIVAVEAKKSTYWNWRQHPLTAESLVTAARVLPIMKAQGYV